MLVLQRKPNEAILIGEDIRIVVLQTDSGGVRLGIDAPESLAILREELITQVKEANRLAAEAAARLDDEGQA
jgi:carbon storage regulator